MKNDHTPEPVPGDEEILSMTAVPVAVAAAYLGWSERTIRSCLREGRVPFGVGVREEQRWKYKILPEPLVKFKHEGLQVVPFSSWTRLTEYLLNTALEPLVEEIRELKDRL